MKKAAVSILTPLKWRRGVPYSGSQHKCSLVALAESVVPVAAKGSRAVWLG